MRPTNHPQTTPVPASAGTSAGFCAGQMGKNFNQINAVPAVPAKTLTYPCACACVRARANAKKNRPSHGYIPLHSRHIRHIVDLYRKNGKKGGTVSGTNHKNPAQQVCKPKWGELQANKNPGAYSIWSTRDDELPLLVPVHLASEYVYSNSDCIDDAIAMRQIINASTRILGRTVRGIVFLYAYQYGMTLGEIGEAFGFTKERARQVLRDAEDDVKKYIFSGDNHA